MKRHELIIGALCVGLGIYILTTGDTVGGTVLIAVGVAVAPLIYGIAWLADRVQSHDDREYGKALQEEAKRARTELAMLRARGLEPVPIPGEQHDPNKCSYCKFKKEGQ